MDNEIISIRIDLMLLEKVKHYKNQVPQTQSGRGCENFIILYDRAFQLILLNFRNIFESIYTF